MSTNTSTQVLLNSIQASLGSATAPNLTSSSAGNDLFEAYVFGLVLEAARIEGANINFENVSGGISTTCTFRTSPGYISTATQDFTHAILSFQNKPDLEVHLGVYVSGRSAVLHECDVAVVDRAEALSCRANQSSPRSNKVILSAECKFYSATPGIGLGRGFLGLKQDLSHECFFVMNLRAQSIERLLSRRVRHSCREEVVPANTHAEALLISSFRSVFHNYTR